MASLGSGLPSARLMGGRIPWVNLRETGRAYRYHGTASLNGVLPQMFPPRVILLRAV